MTVAQYVGEAAQSQTRKSEFLTRRRNDAAKDANVASLRRRVKFLIRFQ